ncbi:MAG: PIG-L family deacetylase [Candidatus Aminicenantes bacterium]|nr:PIG-L family deacetylase [Candidatus Aminicenantes bacterium]MCK4759396.1 PIG-L family deacetylase [Candidatus Aminicenantes bacterium]TEU07886.1 MAG: PIG-L family deacetylase [Candidatus Aminicenantes bacterium]
MKILALGAHPDDIEYGCGGTFLKFARKGMDIYFMVLTKGEFGGDPETREKEQEEAMKLLGVKKIFWGGYIDTELPSERIVITKIDEVIEEVKPDEVYVNYIEDIHQDHRMLAECTLAATRYVKRVFFYEDYTSINFEPDIFVDIEDVLEEKQKLIQVYSSQVDKAYPTKLDMVESVKAIANFRGFQGKVKYAEGFKAFRFLRDV